MPQKRRSRLALAGCTLLGLLVRSGRLDWQPLWWDEGYSAYFATEPIGRMVWLTAHDIHPPLYYALLHGWLLAVQGVQPLALRLFSIFWAVLSLPLLAGLGHLLFPNQPRRWVFAVLLLLFNPLHLFYSQEVRMYTLALTLGLVSTSCLWLTVTQTLPRLRWLAWAGYILSSALALYTLYYLAFLVLAHLLWLLWTLRRHPRRLLAYGLAYGLIALLYAPWLLYAGRDLLNYVITDKIPSDADRPLGPLAYLTRHLLAFSAGHIETDIAPLGYLLWSGVMGIGLLLVMGIGYGVLGSRYGKVVPIEQPIPNPQSLRPNPSSFLWCCLLIPTCIGLLLNFSLPFFPQGGERLLLFVLPYFLLLVSVGLDQNWRRWGMGRLALFGLIVSAATGIWLFYATPRYSADDYRPLIRQITQQGRAGDTLLAIFPWQVGYWRAYSPAQACQLDLTQCNTLRGIDPQQGPAIQLVGEHALTWGPELQAQIEQGLAQGALWLAAPMNLGSTLPAAMEAYLRQQQVTTLENRWVSSTTQLTAWQRLPVPPLTPQDVDYGPVRLIGAGIAPTTVASANQPVNLALQWQIQGQTDPLGITLRLQDSDGHTWANRDYAPLGSNQVMSASNQLLDHVAMVIPVGLPPATYQVMLGVTISGTAQLLPPQTNTPEQSPLLTLATITITQPTAPLPAWQLPIQKFAQSPVTDQPIQILGYAGNVADATLLSGEEVDLTLFLHVHQPSRADQQIYVSLLAPDGAGVAGWEGWSPTQWRASAWPPGALVQAPVTFFTPATLPSGDYQLIAGLLDPSTGVKSPARPLGQVQIRQRSANFTAPSPPHVFDPPVRFGTHADLLGYMLDRQPDHLALTLYWQVQQTLLPPHHIFVHLDDANGTTLAQADGVPVTVDGPAATGTWQAGEYLTTQHQVPLPVDLQAADPAMIRLRVGLYLPSSGERLPATQAGAVIGDAVEIK